MDYPLLAHPRGAWLAGRMSFGRQIEEHSVWVSSSFGDVNGKKNSKRILRKRTTFMQEPDREPSNHVT